MDWAPVMGCFLNSRCVETPPFCCSGVKRHTQCFLGLLSISFLSHFLKGGTIKKTLTSAVLVGERKLGSMPEDTQKNRRWLATFWNSHTNSLRCDALFYQLTFAFRSLQILGRSASWGYRTRCCYLFALAIPLATFFCPSVCKLKANL